MTEPELGGEESAVRDPTSEPQVERRIVTVLFADLVGFTSLSERLDAEDVATIQDAYFAMVRETIGRYGGRLEKFIGDAAMAAFGVPRAGDDDPARAVRAGLALLGGNQQIAAQLGLEEDELQLRVGINTGEVVTTVGGPDEGRVTGDTVNTAARLQAAAPPGSVLVGDATGLAVADIAELEAVAPLELKGKAEPVAAWLVAGLRPQPSREQAMGGLRAPMLGRADELGALRAAWQRARDGGLERWLIAAPPGVGKSRLLGEFAREVEANDDPAGHGLVWRTRSRPETVSPFDPIASLLLDALRSGGLPPDTPSAERNALARAVLLECLRRVGAPELRANVASDAVLAVLSPDAAESSAAPLADRDALFDAWLHAFAALSDGRPTVWVAEDIHWAGRDVLAFLDFAALTRRGEAGRLIVATARPSLLDSEPEWSAADEAGGRHVMQLATLPAGDARALVGALIGDALPDELVARIAERSDGNCLFIEELLRTWVSLGTLVPAGDGWRLTVEAADIPLPTSVQSIYAAQLDDLAPAARLVARRASVAGRRFPVEALAPLGIDSGGGDQGLRSLSRRELISGPLSEPLWPEVFAYRHALLRDAGYSSLARAERARLHVRLARWLEQAAGTRASEIAEQIGGHYAAALESAPALAREIDDGLDRAAARALAAEWYERAGRAALALSAHAAARSLLRRAIDLTDPAADLLAARRWEALADATAYAADMDQGAAAYERAIERYRAVIAGAGSEPDGGDALAAGRSGLARAVAALCEVWYQQLRFAEARDLASAVIEELGDPDPASLARLLVARAIAVEGASGNDEATIPVLERALELARSAGDERVELLALDALNGAYEDAGQSRPGGWQEVGRMAERLGDWGIAIAAMANEAFEDLNDRAADVFSVAERARALAVAHGRTEDAGWSDYVSAEAAFVLGDWDRAIALGNAAAELADANAYRRLRVRVGHVLIPIAAARGDRGPIERAAKWYAALEGPFPDSPYARVMRPAQDLEFAAIGLIPAFVLDVEPRITSYSDARGTPSWLAATDRVFRSWIEAGNLDGAERIVAALSEALSSAPRVSSLASGNHQLLRGRLLLARGDLAAASAAGSAALDAFRFSTAPWWMAKAIRLLERAGSASAELVAEVEEIERRLGCAGPTR